MCNETTMTTIHPSAQQSTWCFRSTLARQVDGEHGVDQATQIIKLILIDNVIGIGTHHLLFTNETCVEVTILYHETLSYIPDNVESPMIQHSCIAWQLEKNHTRQSSLQEINVWLPHYLSLEIHQSSSRFIGTTTLAPYHHN